jgi:hypothetical protein
MTQPRTRETGAGATALALLMLYWGLIAPASVLHFVGVKGLYSTLAAVALAIGIGLATRQRVRMTALISLALVVFLSLASALHWNDVRYIVYPIFFACAVVLVEMAGKEGVDRFCTFATRLIIVLLLGALISFLLAAIGVAPLLAITNPDGQDYYFFYTGFTNSYSENLIRASAIYDEPGAFSMYVCFVSALRHLLKRDRRITWLMLGLGFITFSLAHLVYVFCHFLAEQRSKTRIATLLSLLVLFAVFLSTSILPDSNILLLSRLALTEDTNLFAGDNRSFQMLNAWDQISDNPASLYFGLHSNCVFSQTVCQEQFGTLGENPLSPLAFGGLFSEAPYYVTVIAFLLSPVFAKRYMVVFGIGLLFLQRPYVMGFSYALIAVVLLDLLMRQSRRAIATNLRLRPRLNARSASMAASARPLGSPGTAH